MQPVHPLPAALIALCWAFLAGSSALAQEADFTGEWQTFWRTGSALLTLEQEGDRVTGTYAPDDGRIEGIVEGRVLRATWAQPGSSGQVVFALSQDGLVLTGRFGNGEYWNGFREAAGSESRTWQLGNGSPRETLRSLLIATNVATYQGDAGALRLVGNLVTPAGPATTARDEASRRSLVFELLDMSTIRLNDVPLAPEDPEAEIVRFDVGPAAVPERVTLEFARDTFGRWRLVLPEAERLVADRDRLIGALGHDNKADLDRARADSPGAAMRDFVLGTRDWDAGGRDRALAVMDLSHIPARLHALEGPIYADYLKRILDRIAYIIWQEIPDDPDRSVPHVYFQHPVGNIALARVAEPPAEEGAAPVERWKFTSATVELAPTLLEAMQDLAAIPGLEARRRCRPISGCAKACAPLRPASCRISAISSGGNGSASQRRSLRSSWWAAGCAGWRATSTGTGS
jgi:hypothetical protein